MKLLFFAALALKLRYQKETRITMVFNSYESNINKVSHFPEFSFKRSIEADHAFVFEKDDIPLAIMTINRIHSQPCACQLFTTESMLHVYWDDFRQHLFTKYGKINIENLTRYEKVNMYTFSPYYLDN